MSTWFIRCNGETAHNQPGTDRYIRGEPPPFPKRDFNYRVECLRDGFARVGWPAAGDLRASNWRLLASQSYGSLMKSHHVGYLEQFVGIVPGEIVLLPAYQKRYQVHVGEVVRPRRAALERPGLAYYFHFDIPRGDWYDNAHRVDVNWVRGANGAVTIFEVPEIGGTWIRGFGRVVAGERRIARLAAGLELGSRR